MVQQHELGLGCGLLLICFARGEPDSEHKCRGTNNLLNLDKSWEEYNSFKLGLVGVSVPTSAKTSARSFSRYRSAAGVEYFALGLSTSISPNSLAALALPPSFIAIHWRLFQLSKPMDLL